MEFSSHFSASEDGMVRNIAITVTNSIFVNFDESSIETKLAPDLSHFLL